MATEKGEGFFDEENRKINDELAALDALDTLGNAPVGTMLQAHAKARELCGRAEKVKDALAAKIISHMDSTGVDSVTAGGYRAGFTKRSYYGISPGADDNERRANIAAAREWLNTVAPDLNIPASTNIGRAVSEYLDKNPGAEIPAFLSKSETRSLTNAKK